VVGGADRADAVRRLREALAETTVLGTVTNLSFLRWIAAADWFARGETFTDTIPTRWHPQATPLPEAAWETAARALIDEAPDPLDGWRLNLTRRVRLRSGDEERAVDVDPATERLPVAVEGSPATAHVDLGGRSVAFALAPPPTVESAVRHASVGATGSLALTAPMPGRVIAVLAREGQRVAVHEPLVVLEAMKMENAVAASVAGTVGTIHVRPGQQVQKGDLLVEISE
jgi:3-methylcrotonyl-CoA carboxylase alpha subunit